MRRPLVAGNWKMFKTVGEARVLVSEMLPGLATIQGVDIVLCPPFTSILPVAAMLEGSEIAVGAQNMHWEVSGAYTGEVAPPMLAEFCKYVIIGHSERRQYFGETDLSVNRKVKAALSHQLIPIMCIGETLEENEAGSTAEVVTRQLTAGLDGIDATLTRTIVLAYEPVWAIGTGRAATAEGANAVIGGHIRGGLEQVYGRETAQAVRILYGGSVKASNAGELFDQPDIDGALVGGASLKASEFVPIVAAASR
ncbi:MAG: triose-phosphate isomerase [Anaerolineales bacterium]|nr:triose-phosphate isomerase [Anaerolineae bacterium]PWB53829.1 MAG: triose-phosphate isomerase [Anaerolineales bacterium]